MRKPLPKLILMCLMFLFGNLSTHAQPMFFYSGASEPRFTFNGWNIFLDLINGVGTVNFDHKEDG